VSTQAISVLLSRQTDENQTFSASQEPHTCWRTFHPLIKGDEEMKSSCLMDSMQSARGPA
jgi:hypothetical protein